MSNVRLAEALVLEDNPRELEETAGLLTGSGLVTMATRSPRQAVRWLKARRRSAPLHARAIPSAPGAAAPSPLVHSPAIAVIDWNMELSPDDDPTCEEVLRTLHALHPDTLVIVYGTSVGTDLRLQNRIAGSHPAAIPHDKRQGSETLLTRINRLLTTSVGDLRLERGGVVHQPSHLRHTHAMAVKLLLAYPRAIYLDSASPAAKMARHRFSQWLTEVGSNVHVVTPAHRSSFFQLEIDAGID
jgi:CheY-like chemotaxis protein